MVVSLVSSTIVITDQNKTKQKQKTKKTTTNKGIDQLIKA
jgi:hypothetical protein